VAGDIATSAGTPLVTVSGNMPLFNANTIALAAEVEHRPLRVEVPDTTDVADVRAHLAPRAAPHAGGAATERILLIALDDNGLFDPDVDVRSFGRAAQSAGWRPVRRWSMPDGGEVVELRRPER
jgi:hypothetical protein